MGAMETMMIGAAYVQIGKRLNLPTHAYLGLSDAKIVDGQAGLESGMGALVAAQAGANVISGPGMLDFESCQSLEQRVLEQVVEAGVRTLQDQRRQCRDSRAGRNGHRIHHVVDARPDVVQGVGDRGDGVELTTAVAEPELCRTAQGD